MRKIDEYIIEHFKQLEESISVDELLITASSSGIIEYIEKYLDMGANVNGLYFNTEYNKSIFTYKYTPLYNALTGDHIDCAEYLVKRGADINHPQGLINEIAVVDGDSYFFKLDTGHPDAELEMPNVEFLLNHNADINLLNWQDQSIIESVVMGVTGVWDTVADFLMENGADINLKNSKGKTPLDIIIKEPYRESAIEFLIKRGAKFSKDLN